MKTYRDHLTPRPHFPLEFADRKAGYVERQKVAELERRIAAARLI